MPSLPQLQANQQNAQLSTGPVSANGKAISCLNSLKYGIFARDILAREDEGGIQDYQDLKKGIMESLNPQNQLQATLAEKVATDLWRLRKVLRFEGGAIEEQQRDLNRSMSPVRTETEERIKDNLQNLRDKVEGVKDLLKNISKKSFKLHQVDEEPLEILYDAAHSIYRDDIEPEDANRLYNWEMDFNELKETLDLTNPELLNALKGELKEKIGTLSHEVESQQAKLEDFYEARKAKQDVAALPAHINIDKLLKYERSLQRSIHQNIAMIYRLQGLT